MTAGSVTVRILGETSANIDGRLLGPEAPHVFAAVLVLALSPQHRVTRRRLATLLWPDAPSGRQAERLRWLLSKLRGLGLAIDASNLDVSLAGASVDVQRATELHEIDAVLPDYAPDFSAPFRRWVEEQREVATDVLLTRLVPLLAEARLRGDWSTTDRVARVIRKVAPMHEEATLALAEALCAGGDKVRGAALLDEYVEALGEDRPDLRLSAEVLRRRIRAPDQTTTGAVVPAAFVGRRASMRRFQKVLADATAGRGGALLFAGPAGIGKTRLLDEMAAFASTVGQARVVRARCHAGDVARPLSGVIDLIPRLVELPGAAGCDPAMLTRLEQLSEFESGKQSNALSPGPLSAVRDWLQHAMLDLLSAVSEERITVIMVDDFQWSDASVRWLWDSLLSTRTGNRVVWCFAARSESVGGAEALLPNDARSVLSVEWLAGLEAQEATALIGELLSRTAREASVEVRATILERGGGSPLVLQELVRHWHSTGDLTSVPPTLVALIDARLARLTPAARRTLQLVGLLGPYATLDRIERVLQLPRTDFVEALGQLENAGILTTDSAGHTYGHVLWADAAVALLEPSVARVLHRHIAEHLELEMANAPSVPLLWETARHWEGSGQSTQELAAITNGAEHLVRNGFYVEAAEVYGRALDRSGDAQQQCRLLRRRIDLFRWAAHWPEMVSDIDRHERLSVALNPLYDTHNELEMLTHVAHYATHDVPIEQIAREAFACASAADATAAHRINAAFNCARYADVGGMGDLLERAHRIAMGLIPDTLESVRHQTMCDILYHSGAGDPQRALTVAAEWASAERERGNAYWTCWSTRARGMMEANVGDVEDARRSCLESIEIARAARLDGMMAAGYELLTEISIDHDDPKTALELLETVSRLGESFYWQTVQQVVVRSRRAQLAVEAGDADGAAAVMPPRDIMFQFGGIGRATRTAFEVSMLLLRARGMTEANDLDSLGAELSACFSRPQLGLRWAASVYAEFLERRHGSQAADEFIRHFTRNVQRERGRPTRRLAPFVARAFSEIQLPATRPIATQVAQSA